MNTNSVFEIYQVNFIVSDSGAHVLNSWTQEDQNLQEVWLGLELWPFLKLSECGNTFLKDDLKDFFLSL